MLTDRRDRVRARLLALARADARVSAAALTGSAAAGREDEWSDIDLFFGVADVPGVLADFTDSLYAELGAIHHFDLAGGGAVYRAFLLDGSLEVDLGFIPTAEFRSFGDAPFSVVFGDAGPPSPAYRVDVDHLAGRIWHHVRHARSSIERGRPWSAEYWISQARFQVLTLAADRHGLEAAYAKGADSLPEPIRASLIGAVVRDLEPEALYRALAAVTAAALTELREHDAATAERLAGPLLAAARRGPADRGD